MAREGKNRTEIAEALGWVGHPDKSVYQALKRYGISVQITRAHAGYTTTLAKHKTPDPTAKTLAKVYKSGRK